MRREKKQLDAALREGRVDQHSVQAQMHLAYDALQNVSIDMAHSRQTLADQATHAIREQQDHMKDYE